MESTKGAVRQMTMVERMARAMFSIHYTTPWMAASTGLRQHYLGMAIAALHELREPTLRMERAATTSPTIPASYVIRAAVDEAIAEHEAAR